MRCCFTSIALVSLWIAGCAGSGTHVRDAHDYETDPVASMLRWMPDEASFVGFVDLGTVERAGLMRLIEGAGFDPDTAGAELHAVAIGSSIEGLVAEDEATDPPMTVVLAFAQALPGELDGFEPHGDSLVLREGDQYQVRLPDGHFAVVPARWLDSVAHARAIPEGSPAATLRALMPTTGDPALGGFGFLVTPGLRAHLVAGAEPAERELVEGATSSLVSCGMVAQGTAERVRLSFALTMRDAESLTLFHRMFSMFRTAFIEGMLEELPALAAHRAALENAVVETQGATMRITIELPTSALEGITEGGGDEPLETAEDELTLLEARVAELADADAFGAIVAALEPELDDLLQALPTRIEAERVLLQLLRAYRQQGRLASMRALLERIDPVLVAAGTPGEGVARLRLQLAGVLKDLGDYDAAMRTYALAESTLGATDVDLRASAVLSRMILSAVLGDAAGLRADIARYEALMRQRGAPVWEMENNVAWALALGGRSREAVPLVTHAIEALSAESPSDPRLAAYFNTRGVARLNENHPAEAYEDFLNDVAIRRRLGHADDERLLFGLSWACVGASRARKHREAIAHCEEVLAAAAAIGRGGERPYAEEHPLIALTRFRLGQARFRAGEREAGLAEARQGVALLARSVLATQRDRMEAERWLSAPR